MLKMRGEEVPRSLGTGMKMAGIPAVMMHGDTGVRI